MSPMAEQIVELVEARRHVSFAELCREIEGFDGGELELRVPGCTNIVLWSGMTDAACDAIEELQKADRIHQVPASWMTYLIDGAALKLPIVKTARRHYKKPHWLPVVFNPGPLPP